MSSAIGITFIALQVMLRFQEGRASLQVEYPTKNILMPGETFSFACSGTLNANEEFRFMKMDTVIPIINGFAKSGSVDGVTLSTFGEVDSSLPQETKDRYTVTGSRDGNNVNYRLTITAVIPGDMGNFTCITDPSFVNTVPLAVMGPVTKIELIYQGDRPNYETSEAEKNQENEYMITYNTTGGGDLVARVGLTTLQPKLVEAKLFDPVDNTTRDVTSDFRPSLTSTFFSVKPGGIRNARVSNHYNADIDDFGAEANGKKLTFKAQTDGFEAKELTAILNVQYPPIDTKCVEKSPQAPEGTANFTLICYTNANPTPTLSWKANNADLRSGITVRNEVNGRYLVSVLTISQIQESDFTMYKFHAENMLGTAEEESGSITKGTTIVQAKMNTEGTPWYVRPSGEPESSDSAYKRASIWVAVVAVSLAMLVMN